MINCKICDEKFSTDKSFHLHLKKHDIYQGEYYCKYFPRYSLYYKRQIPFFNKKQYFNTEFFDVNEFLAWEKNEKPDLVKAKCIELLEKRIKEKQYKYAPFHNEIKTLELPPIEIYKKYFSSYSRACQLLGTEPIFNQPMPKEFYEEDVSNHEIIIDTREQDPLPYSNSRIEKIYVGDYLLGDYYSNTFVDRKSESDFLGTLASGVNRFEREIERAVGLNSYLFVVIESSIEEIISNHKKFRRKTNLEYVFHNMRHLTHKYPRNLQFVFTHNRKISLDIIPRLLYHGNRLWKVDVQYYLDNKLFIL